METIRVGPGPMGQVSLYEEEMKTQTQREAGVCQAGERSQDKPALWHRDLGLQPPGPRGSRRCCPSPLLAVLCCGGPGPELEYFAVEDLASEAVSSLLQKLLAESWPPA